MPLPIKHNLKLDLSPCKVTLFGNLHWHKSASKHCEHVAECLTSCSATFGLKLVFICFSNASTIAKLNPWSTSDDTSSTDVPSSELSKDVSVCELDAVVFGFTPSMVIPLVDIGILGPGFSPCGRSVHDSVLERSEQHADNPVIGDGDTVLEGTGGSVNSSSLLIPLSFSLVSYPRILGLISGLRSGAIQGRQRWC